MKRRHFLQRSLATATAASSPAALAQERPPRSTPSNRITLGLIGNGGRGEYLLKWFLEEPDAQIVAVCDVDRLHYRDRKWGNNNPHGRKAGKTTVDAYYGDQGCQTHTDYRELCARDDIDAVLVATPDHWHAHQCLEALRQGKDVYGEKPITHLFAEGQEVYQEVARQNAIFQVGSQQRSEGEFHLAVELIRNGVLGKVHNVEVGLPPGHHSPQRDETFAVITDPPDGLDYEAWCGPSPKLPYMRARHHRHWRWHRAYGGGQILDWIGHHNDIAHWALDQEAGGPTQVNATDFTWAKTEIYDTAVDFTIECEYKDGVQSSISSRHRKGTKWIGEHGWIFVDRGEIEASNPEWLTPEFGHGGSWRAYDMQGRTHYGNFLDSVKTRRPPVAPAENGHRCITPGHLAYVSAELGRPLSWDPATETIVNDTEAQTLLMKREYREGRS
ncbi:MAG: Gfo/Idh/MocA family oxidoreductase [Verrucomicrobiota bacterium]